MNGKKMFSGIISCVMFAVSGFTGEPALKVIGASRSSSRDFIQIEGECGKEGPVPYRSKIYGKNFTYSFLLPNGNYDVELGFCEFAWPRKGDCIFDVAMQKKTVLKNYDVRAQVPARTVVKEKFPVVVNNGKLEIDFIGLKDCAFVNFIKVSKDGKEVISIDCGFMDKKRLYFSDTVNLVPNPSFENKENEKEFPGWKKKGSAKLSRDNATSKSGLCSAKVSDSSADFYLESENMPWIDYSKNYTFSGWMKGNAASGETYICIKWYKSSKKAQKETMYDIHSIDYISETKSKILKGDCDWTEFKITATPPRDATNLKFYIVSKNNKGTVWVDDLKFDGFGNEEICILNSQAGYHPNGVKEMPVWTLKNLKSAKFFVKEKGTGKTVYEGDLSFNGQNLWKRYDWTADFSRFEKEGCFYVDCVFENGDKISSHEFSISRDIYKNMARNSMEWYYLQRCGVDVPGWHAACHLDDGILPNGKHLDTTGGWHDAGDYSKFTGEQGTSIYSLVVMHDSLNPEWRKHGQKLADSEAIIKWGAENLLKFQKSNGLFYGGISSQCFGPKRNRCKFLSPEKETNNIPGDKDDRIIIEHMAWPRSLRATLGLAKSATALKKSDPEFASSASAAAEKALKAIWEQRGQGIDDRVLTEDSIILSIDVNLYKSTGRDIYKKDAALRAEKIMKCMDNERYFIDLMPNPWDKYYLQPFFYIISLMECAEEYKGEILSERIKKCIDKYMKNVMLPLTKRSPFGHVGDFQKKNPSLFRLTYKSSSGSYGLNAYISCASFIFSKAACLLNKPEYLDIAERQVQWIAGRNPKGCSMVAGMGYKRAGVFTHMSAIPSHRDAQVTGGVISGFLGGNGTKTGRDGGHPIDFPVINISSSGYASVEPGSAEAWQINTGWFLLAVSNLHDAKEKFEKMKKEK